MSSISYNTPPLNHKNAAVFNLYLKAFDENMRLAGLIRNNIPGGATYTDSFGAQPIFDYNYNAFEPFYSTLTVKQTSYWYNTQYLCSMEYKLPIGNGKIIFADDPTYPGYKKINQASYESTEVIIRFNFVLNSGVNGNVSNTLNQRYILCYPTIYTKDYFAIATPGTGYAFAPNSGAYSNVAGRYILIGQNAISFRPTTIRISDAAQKIHLAVTFVSGTLKVYVNGVLSFTQSGVGNPNTFTDTWIIGMGEINCGYPIKMSRVAIYNAEVSVTDIYKCYNISSIQTT